MTEQKCRRYVVRLFTAANRRDLSAFGGLLAADLVYQSTSAPSVKHSREEMEGVFLAFWGAFPDARYMITGMVVDETKIATEIVVTGTHAGEFLSLAPTGRRIEMPACVVTTHEGSGRIKIWKSYYDVSAVLRELMVAPP